MHIDYFRLALLTIGAGVFGVVWTLFFGFNPLGAVAVGVLWSLCVGSVFRRVE